MAVVAMFPLGTVLLPGAVLPLQVFEPRYRTMIHDLLAGTDDVPQFGVVLIERGREVGGGDQRADVGTLATIVDISVLPDGRFALLAAGSRRFRVLTWLPDDPYPVADIEEWSDEPLDSSSPRTPDDIVADLYARVRALNDELRAMGEPPPRYPDISDDPGVALYHLGSLAPLGPADRQRMLTSASFDERAAVLAAALDDAAAVVRFRSS